MDAVDWCHVTRDLGFSLIGACIGYTLAYVLHGPHSGGRKRREGGGTEKT